MTYGRGGARPPRRQVSYEQILERVHSNLYSIVAEAVDDCKVEEDKWGSSEMVKRIVGYIYKAAKAVEVNKPWQEVAKALVNSAMGSYESACGERPWFYQMALGNAFTSAVWELMQTRGKPNVHFQDVQDFVVREFESNLDRSLLSKAVWDATEATFSDPTVVGKVFRAVKNTYQPIFEEMLNDTRPVEEARKVELFTKKWMEASMQRAWSSIDPDQADTILSAQKIQQLFQNLIAPFGEGHDYTCIPVALVENIGRPPRNWRFLRQTVSKMLEDWKQAHATPQPAKRRKKAAQQPDEEMEGEELEKEQEELGEVVNGKNGLAKEEEEEALYEEDAELQDALVKDEEEELGGAGADAPAEMGHPECTSDGDCLGNPESSLVRHIIEGDDGDVYCEVCWASFLAHNEELEGQWEDGENAGQPFTQ
eukprot:CAMPEP_0181459468 /NCGR_PEP_ID=MMETSP1110-20121109/32841_1 /TAXON_ID=174948 /ORGANISM="Symbiodinium sp., Strain CCMP421" /LENGTH=423 /DNA_ID=CAMNT_0023583989 /DNA_START=37 /DNA_END=1308 /DNA_ORIENTATION=-